MPLSSEQRAARRLGIGGSDAAGILGKSSRKTPLAVYDSKVNDWPDESSEYAELGNELEPVILRLAAKRLGLEITVPTKTFRHREHEWMLANLDGETSDGGIFEAKACFDWRKAKELGPEGTDWVLEEHFFQVQHYMEVRDVDHAHVAYFVEGKIRLYFVRRDREIGEALVREEGRFWREHVLARRPPDESDPFVVAEYLAHAFPGGKAETLTAEPGGILEAACARLAEARRAIKAAERMECAAANDVKAIMGEATRVECAFGTVSWSPGGSRVSWKDVARALKPPKSLIEKHTKSTARRFTPTFEGESDDSAEE